MIGASRRPGTVGRVIWDNICTGGYAGRLYAVNPHARQRAAASHTAAVATPLVTREALFAQAGVVVVPGFGDLIETSALLATQPVPAGSTVAIVSNIGGAGVLAADACTDLGLTVHQPHEQIRRRLRALIPKGGAADGPIDTTAAVSAGQFRECLELKVAPYTPQDPFLRKLR